MALCSGDEASAKYKYINMRVEVFSGEPDVSPEARQASSAGGVPSIRAPIALGLGVLSVFLHEVGIIPVAGLVVSVLAVLKAWKTGEGWTMCLWAVALNTVYLFVHLYHLQRIPEAGLGVMAAIALALFLGLLVEFLNRRKHWRSRQ
jgi:hypothetical protein